MGRYDLSNPVLLTYTDQDIAQVIAASRNVSKGLDELVSVFSKRAVAISDCVARVKRQIETSASSKQSQVILKNQGADDYLSIELNAVKAASRQNHKVLTHMSRARKELGRLMSLNAEGFPAQHAALRSMHNFLVHYKEGVEAYNEFIKANRNGGPGAGLSMSEQALAVAYGLVAIFPDLRPCKPGPVSVAVNEGIEPELCKLLHKAVSILFYSADHKHKEQARELLSELHATLVRTNKV